LQGTTAFPNNSIFLQLRRPDNEDIKLCTIVGNTSVYTSNVRSPIDIAFISFSSGITDQFTTDGVIVGIVMTDNVGITTPFDVQFLIRRYPIGSLPSTGSEVE
jgi:hypothetical protein